MTRTRNGNGWISPGLMLDCHLFSFLCSAITFLAARQRCFIPDSSLLVEKDPVHKPVPNIQNLGNERFEQAKKQSILLDLATPMSHTCLILQDIFNKS